MDEREYNEHRDSTWRLEKIEFEFKSYGENKGKYEGKIRFQNGEYESFCFKIRPEMAEKYIAIMSSDIVSSATDLGERLKKSLGLEAKKIG